MAAHPDAAGGRGGRRYGLRHGDGPLAEDPSCTTATARRTTRRCRVPRCSWTSTAPCCAGRVASSSARPCTPKGSSRGVGRCPGSACSTGSTTSWARAWPSWPWCAAAPRSREGWPVEAVCRAGELAAPELVELVQPYAPGVLAEHREAGHLIVLTTTTPGGPRDPVRRHARLRPCPRHPLRARRRSLHRGHRGRLRVVDGQARRGAALGRGSPTSTWSPATPIPTACSTCPCSARSGVPTP